MTQYDVALSYAKSEQSLVSDVFHYLKAEGLNIFFAPECQSDLSGENQREVFYKIFGIASHIVVLFVSENYIVRDVPMEEARIAISKHSKNGRVIPVYLDSAILPKEIFDPKSYNYFQSNSAAVIANHISERYKLITNKAQNNEKPEHMVSSTMNNSNNQAQNQIFINNFKL